MFIRRKKIWQKHRETRRCLCHADPSDRICRIVGPHRRSRSLILITRLLLWPDYLSSTRSSASPPIRSVLRPDVHRTLLNILGKYDRNRCRSRHPAVDKLRHGGSAPPRLRLPSASCKLIGHPRQDCGTKYFTFCSRARGGVTRSTRKVADDPRYTPVLTRNP